MDAGSQTGLLLNRWQRLWVVLTTLWLILVCFAGYLTWPQLSNVSHGEVYARILESSTEVVQTKMLSRCSRTSPRECVRWDAPTSVR